MDAEQRKSWIVVSASFAVVMFVLFPLGYAIPFGAFWVVFLIQLLVKPSKSAEK